MRSPLSRTSGRSLRSAFTLLEIMVVLAIIGLLAGLAITNVDKIFGGSKITVAQIFVKQSMKTALTTYRITVGDYPSTEEGLQALFTAPANKADRWRGPYIAEGTTFPLLDPWNEPYQYRYPAPTTRRATTCGRRVRITPTARMTISETGERRGFTLLEVLLALALIALLATVFVGASSALLADKPLSPDDQFWKLCAEARKSALEGSHNLVVSYDGKSRAFVLNDGTSTRSIPVSGPPDLVIDFISSDRDASTSLIGGTVVQTNPIPFVTFYSDGTCTPFRAQFRLNSGAHILELDPWTCAPMLQPIDAKS